MNSLSKTLVIAAFAAFATPLVTSADVPASATQNVLGTMNYQGYLADPSTGAAYADGIYTLDIRIWNSAANSSGCLWGGKYTVYVKGGYFNIMLGDPNAAALTTGTTPTYSNTELWKALWGSSSEDTVRYLGVTPYQDSSHNTISSPVEIAPRQQLLTSPFAFRAQHAHYADQAQADFTVPGKLTVNGTTSFSRSLALPSGSSLGPVQASSTSVNLGNGYTSATASNRSGLPTSIYDIGQYLYFYSYYSMHFQPTAGSVNFSIPSGYFMNVNGSGTFNSSVPVNTIGGTGTTTIKGGSVTVNSTAGVELKGKTISLHPSEVAESAVNGVAGQGNVKWALPGKTTSSGVITPIKIVSFSVVMGTSSNVKTVDIASSVPYYAEYRWVAMNPYVTDTSVNVVYVVPGIPSATQFLVATALNKVPSSSITVNATLVGYHKCFSQITSVSK